MTSLRWSGTLTEIEFQRLLQAGHGRAIQFARTNDVSPFRDVILDMCLHNRAVDPMFEGTHAYYVWALLLLLPDREFYFGRILEALCEAGDDWDAVHRFCLGRKLVEESYPQARELLYQHFRPGPRRGDHIGCEFVSLEGLAGFLFAAGKIGGEKSELLLWAAGEKCGEDVVMAALREGAANDPGLAAFLAGSLTHRKESVFELVPFEELAARLNSLTRSQLRRWGREAPPEEFDKAARALADTRNPALLPIFIFRAFPLDPGPLVAMAEWPDAVRALEEVVHPEVRSLAFRLCEARLLTQNSQPGDVEMALSWFLAETDRHRQHMQGIGLRSLLDGDIEVLKLLYEHTPCSQCREFIVDDLVKLNALPAIYRLECADDANDEIRGLCK